MSEPLFSIVMPVRDGEATLAWAVESALHQEHDDYEIVILDNNSHDATPDIIADHGGSRIRVFRNDATLPMPDNFERAWELARGEYVLYLCDDDALLPTALARVEEVLRERSPVLVSWEYAFYYHPDWHNETERNTMRVIPASGEIKEEPTDELRRRVYAFKEPRWSPRMQNCCVRRTFFEGTRRRFGRLFLGPCPDYSFLALTMEALEAFTAIHRPLHIAGRSSGSIGAVQATTLGKEAEKFLDESGGEQALQAGPCGVPVLVNFIAATLANANGVIAGSGGNPPLIDVVACFERAARNIKTIEKYTGSRNDLREALKAAAFKIGGGTEEAVSSVLDAAFRRSRSLTRCADAIIGSSELLSRIEVSLRFSGDPNRARRPYDIEDGVSIRNNEVFVQGKALGVESILGMTGVVDRLFDELAQPRAWVE